jgi:hypothetical protein
MPLPRSSRARLSPSICFISTLRIDSQAFSRPLAQLSGFFFCFFGARQGVERTFQLTAFGHGRCGRREKFGGPPLLKLSLKVKWNNAHNQSSAFVDARVSRPQRARSIKDPQSNSSAVLPVSRSDHRGGTERAVILKRRAQPGRYPLHRIGFGDDLIDVIAIDALKRAQLEADARGLDLRQDHWRPTLGTWVGLNRDPTWIK